MILLDTNILTASKQPGHPDYGRVTARLQQFMIDGEELAICPQNLYEFYTAATRPIASRGLGFTKQQALAEMENLKTTYTLIDDPTNLYSDWEKIITQYDVSGKQAHDARLVAFMQGVAIDTFYTNNVQDFNRYTDIITVLN